ncbi:Protein SAWADEE HOMEODOMAIN like [Melia azedarach]|uniref:Protein SAWADEE HOMEODOMAIN like n=1 Tax=Melia azedarach TaxID=155640 RepID=A0ACC1X9Q9_MELAZ|nr:Protein SAWADEE HOMEODOMAIN like [Melia azedarach]
MDRLRPRQRMVFVGFTKAEVEKMEKLLEESKEDPLSKQFCRKIAKSFNCSAGRAGKPIVKWTEVRCWFRSRLQDRPSKVASSTNLPKTVPELPEACPPNKKHESSQEPRGEKTPDLSDLEFEARSSKDGAWYDVDIFLAHRFLASGEAEVRVRFVGFGAEEDEWVNVKKAVRERSIPLEHSDCHKLKVGDLVLCFQERRDQAIYYDAHIVEIQRRIHDIRGCRCLFLVRYNHDNTEERVRLRRLCCRPTI